MAPNTTRDFMTLLRHSLQQRTVFTPAFHAHTLSAHSKITVLLADTALPSKQISMNPNLFIHATHSVLAVSVSLMRTSHHFPPPQDTKPVYKTVILFYALSTPKVDYSCCSVKDCIHFCFL